MTSDTAIPPPGYNPHFRTSPLTDPWAPLYSKSANGSFIIGLLVRTPHTNARGLLHGGLIAALADNAMGLACALASDGFRDMITVSLTVDLLGRATLGDWIEFNATPAKIGRSLAYAACKVTSDEGQIARASAIFSVPKTPAPERTRSYEPE